MGNNIRPKPRISVVYWGDQDGIGSLIKDTFMELGFETGHFRYDEKIPADLDLIFCYAPFGSLVPLVNQLTDLEPAVRPQFALWLTEPLPNPAIPAWVRRAFGTGRSQSERFAYRRAESSSWNIKKRWQWLTTRGYRYRYYGDLYWLKKEGLLSALGVTSRIVTDYLSKRGFSPVLAYMGSHPSYGADLKLERDIPVLWIGKIASRRRNKLLTFVRGELKQKGIDLLMIDGVENPYVFGDERTVLFNRTRIVLNLLRTEYDDNSMRYYLAAPNRALIVSEPTLRHTPFEPGVHLVEAPIEQIPDTIAYYLQHGDACSPFIDKAYELVKNELSMKNGIRKIMDSFVVRETKSQIGI